MAFDNIAFELLFADDSQFKLHSPKTLIFLAHGLAFKSVLDLSQQRFVVLLREEFGEEFIIRLLGFGFRLLLILVRVLIEEFVLSLLLHDNSRWLVSGPAARLGDASLKPRTYCARRRLWDLTRLDHFRSLTPGPKLLLESSDTLRYLLQRFRLPRQ